MLIQSLLANPRAAMSQLAGPEGPPYIEHVYLRFHDSRLVVLDVTLRPVAAMAAAGYPIETVTLFVSHVQAFAVPPFDDKRTWEHRLGPLTPGSWIVPLCLWYPADPVELRWTPLRPVEDLIGIVHRHLQAEEYFRRSDRWPVAEAPHGATGPLPITGELLKAFENRRAS